MDRILETRVARRRTAAWVCALAGVLGACGGDSPAGLSSPPVAPPPAAPPNASLAVASGDAQIGAPGAPLGQAPSVRVTDSDGDGVPGLGVSFSVVSGGGSVATPTTSTDAGGRASAGVWTLGEEEGTQELRATVEGVGAVTFRAIARTRVPAQITVLRGDGQSAPVGSAVAVPPAVTVRDGQSAPLPGVTVTFRVTAGGGSITGGSATTNASGVAEVGSWTLGAAIGANRLEAAVAGMAGSGISGNPVTFSATATATGDGGSGGGGLGFDIEIRFNPGSTPTGAQQNAFDDAVGRWERVVSDDLPGVDVNRPGGACSSPDPLVETIDDLVIFITLETIDGPGGVLGSAGPCMVRSGSNLPLVGRMRLDTDDLAALETNGLLEKVILHEMGHVLGIGTLWNAMGLLGDPAGSGGVDPHFTGIAAIAAFNAIGGSGYTGQKVPVENTGGAGTRDSHWRESVFDKELMTGWMDPGSSPLSLVTIQSLADMGYDVDTSEAEAAGLAISPSYVPWGEPGPRAIRLADDVWRGPIEVVDAAGRPGASLRD